MTPKSRNLLVLSIIFSVISNFFICYEGLMAVTSYSAIKAEDASAVALIATLPLLLLTALGGIVFDVLLIVLNSIQIKRNNFLNAGSIIFLVYAIIAIVASIGMFVFVVIS